MKVTGSLLRVELFQRLPLVDAYLVNSANVKQALKGWQHFERCSFGCMSEHQWKCKQRVNSQTPKNTFWYTNYNPGCQSWKENYRGTVAPSTFFYSRCFSCTSVYPTDLVNQHNNITEHRPSSPSPRNSSWGLIYFDIWRDLILMPTKNSKKLQNFEMHE